MPLFKSRSRSGNLNVNDEAVVNILRGSTSSGYVSATEALKNSDIYAVIFQLSNDLANSTLIAGTSRVQAMLNNPTTTANAHGFWQSMFAQLLLDGNAYAYRWRNVNGVDLNWQYLRPSQVQVKELDDGSGLVYNITFDELDLPYMENVPASDVIHLRLMSKNGGKTGISPLMALGNELDIKDANNKLTLSALAKAVMSPGVLTIKHGGLLNFKQKSARSNEFVRQLESSNNGPIVLDDLEEYNPLEMKSDIAALLSQTDWTSKQIAKVYGVPDSILNGQGDQQSSLDMMQGQYANALNRYEQNILSELNNKLNTNITANVRGAIDPSNNGYASKLTDMVKGGLLSSDQALWLLQDQGYIPKNLPAAKNKPLKGGEKDDKENSD